MKKTIALLVCLALAATAGAQVIEYYGIDPAVGIGEARPNSDAAAAGFDSDAGVLGVIHSIDFEALSLGNFVTRNIGPDVDATLTGTDPEGGIVAGLGNAKGDLFVEFDDGSFQSLPVSGHVDGGVLFHGFTDAGASIVSVTLERNVTIVR